jgi:hypothetical protein
MLVNLPTTQKCISAMFAAMHLSSSSRESDLVSVTEDIAVLHLCCTRGRRGPCCCCGKLISTMCKSDKDMGTKKKATSSPEVRNKDVDAASSFFIGVFK